MIAMVANLFNDKQDNIRSKVVAVYLLLFVSNVAAWIWAVVAFHNYPVLLGTAALAYSFGLRHAFDADHIAAIDNVTRKLMQEGKRPVGVGLFFSLGHSTIVVALSIAIAVTATALQDQFRRVQDASAASSARWCRRCSCSPSRSPTSWSCSRSIGRFRRVKSGGRFVEEDLDLMLANRGLAGAPVPPLFPPDRAQLAHVSARRAVRPRLRHGDRSRPARHFGDAGLAGSVDLVDPGVSGAVHGRA